ncbi:MAG: WYL domain-containing protein [Chitinophagales bacterium]|nr:WYL domain-containing protein [Chitinophagales bacterium]
MPLNREAYTRYRLIDARLRKKPYPQLEDLIEHVSGKFDKPVSKRTVQLDLQEMRYNQALNFNAPIVYDKKEKFYRYSDESYSINNLPVTADELHGLDFAISILNQFKHLPAIKEFEDAIIKIAGTVQMNKDARGESDHIQLDKPFIIKGIEFVEPILKAISERRVIKFTYQKHGSDTTTQNLLEPYIIRESKNFWYVIGNGISKKEHKILTFALDRILDLQLTGQTFSDEKIDKKNFYKNVLGVTVAEGKPEKVLLSFSPLQGKYVKTLPIHHSQQIVKETANELRVSLNLVVNTELKMQLLSYGSNVKVLQPKTLAEELKQTAEKMVELYG